MPQKRTRQTTTRSRAVSSNARASASSGARASRSAASSARRGSSPSARRSAARRAQKSTPVTYAAGSVTPRSTGPGGLEVTIPGKGEVLLTRRHFLYGLAGVAAVAALGTGGFAYTQMKESDASDVATLAVPESAVFTSDDCTAIEEPATVMSMVCNAELPYGSLVWANDDTVAACLMPTETAKPLAQIGLLALGSGTCSTVVGNAVGESEGFEIYDVRACAKGLVWVEADILEGVWRVYQATNNENAVGTAVLVEEGNSSWEMPTLAAVGDYAFWQLLPNLNGDARLEDSKLKRARFGSSDVEEVYVSHGRMACAPSAAKSGVVITPRADTTGTYYQLTHIDAATGQATDALTLPASMKPFEAGFGTTGFSFAFEGIYDYGEGISNLGTYAPAQQVTGGLTGKDAADAYGSAAWFRFPRTPSCAPAWCGNWLVVKSTKSVAGINLSDRTSFSLDVENGADTYGEFLASSGECSRVVTYTNIDYTPISGERTRKCLVKVWAPV